MIDIKFDITELKKNIRASTEAIERDIQRATHKASRECVAMAKRGEFKDVTGELRNSITLDMIGWMGDTYTCLVYPKATHAIFVELDTKPHWIYPKAGYSAPVGSLMPGQTRRGRGAGPHEHVVGRGRALRWKNASGQECFATRVYHPGTAGFHFMYRAGEYARIKLIQELHGNFRELRSVWTR
jgi:hypothetical protein